MEGHVVEKREGYGTPDCLQLLTDARTASIESEKQHAIT
jgi:hypothetical protein